MPPWAFGGKCHHSYVHRHAASCRDSSMAVASLMVEVRAQVGIVVAEWIER
jgi:hypothetical protein